MAELPTGTVTFLLTDIEGSTRLWEEHPDLMRPAVSRHDALLTAAIEGHGGVIVRSRGEGDSFFGVFARASDAVAAAAALQLALLAEPWPSPTPIRVRVGMNTGEAELRQGDYYGSSINRCARLRALAVGGQTLLGRTTYELSRDDLPPHVSLLDLGAHRLKDLQRPEQVFQLLHPHLPEDFPPLKSLDRLPNNLPVQLTSFIGREREMAEVKQLLGTTRLLTLTGPGGTGKTRLALQLAADLLPEMKDGAWLVELASLADPDLVPQTVAAVLGVREQSGHPVTQTLADALQSSQMLLVLDNCEHLLPACAALAGALLRRSPGLRILATSREGLNLIGETLYRLPSLSLPDRRQAASTVESVTQYEAVRLFIERAQASQPGFAVTEGNAPAVAEVCSRLDGIPLAIELAAARVRVLTAEQLMRRLDDRFRLLTGGSRGAMARQQTLRATMDWSYELLTEGERVLLRRLSVFAGGFTLEAAEAICAGDPEHPLLEEWEVLDLLGQLVDKSLVNADEQGEEVRYRLLETIRQYGQEHLRGAAEEAALRARQRDWFLGLAERAEPELHGPRQGEWLERLEKEHDNLRAALDWSVEAGASLEEGAHSPETGHEAEAGLRLGGALWRFWHVRGYWAEGRGRLAALLALAKETPPRSDGPAHTAARANALYGAGILASSQGDYVAARVLHEDSLAIQREVGDRHGIGKSLNALGRVAQALGEYGAARGLYEESLSICREMDDRHGIAFSLYTLGSLGQDEGDYPGAQALYEESLAIQRELGDARGVASSLVCLGLVAQEQGDYNRARAFHEESLAISRELRDLSATAASLHNLGLVAHHQAEYEAARALYEESLAIRRELGETRNLAVTLNNLANMSLNQGDYGTARALHEETLAIRRKLGDKRGIATSLTNLGVVTDCQGDYQAALSLTEESLQLQRELGNPWGVAAALTLLGLVAYQQGRHEAARTLYGESLAIRRELGDRLGIVESVEGLAELAMAQGQLERAVRLVGTAAALRDALGTPVPPNGRAQYERDLAAMRAALGEEAFTATWAAGRTMTLEDAVRYALDNSALGTTA